MSQSNVRLDPATLRKAADAVASFRDKLAVLARASDVSAEDAVEAVCLDISVVKRLDTVKAAAIMREAGLRADVSVSGGYLFGYAADGDFVAASSALVIGSIDGSGRSAEAMEALAARLLAMAAVCRRIEAEAITETPS